MPLRKLLLLLLPCACWGQATINGMANQAVANIQNCLGGTASVINGVSYTNCYSGSTLDVRVNAAMSDAENLSNGNTTGIVDSTYEPYNGITQTGQITVGDGTHVVLWRLGAGMYSEVTLTSGTAYAVLQNPYSSIVCLGNNPTTRCVFQNYSAANNIYAMYGTNGVGYYRMSGVQFATLHGSNMASGHVGIITAAYDGSTWDNDSFLDSPASNPGNGAVVTITGTCCHSNFTNDYFDSEWGSTAVDIEATSGSKVNGLNFHDNTFNTHGPTASGSPNILCHDVGPGLYSTISFTGVTYMEGQAAAMTAPWINDNGCASIDISGVLIADSHGGTGTTSPIIAVQGGFDSTLNVGDTVAFTGSGSWTYPATIVKQYNTTTDCGSPPCNVAVTDANGNSPGYHSRTSQFNNIAIGGSGTAPTQAAETNNTTLATTAYVNSAPKFFKLMNTLTVSGTGNYDDLPALAQAITINSASLFLLTAPAGCSTYPVINLWDMTAGSSLANVTLAASTNTYTMNVTGTAGVSGHVLGMRVSTAASGCSTNASSASLDVQYN